MLDFTRPESKADWGVTITNTHIPVALQLLREGAQAPQYMSAEAAGADCFASLDEPICLNPGERRVIPLGFAVQLPPKTELQLRPRSGLALKHGVTLANGVGTIDADYRGEVGAILTNLGESPFWVDPGMRVCQAILAPVLTANYVVTQNLSTTERGEGGFGHSGV